MEIFRNHSPWLTGLYAGIIVLICGVIGHGNMDLRLPGGLQYVIFPTYLLGIFSFMRGTPPTDSEILLVHQQIVFSSALVWSCIGYLAHILYRKRKKSVAHSAVTYQVGDVPSKRGSVYGEVATTVVTMVLIVILLPVIIFVLDILGILDL